MPISHRATLTAAFAKLQSNLPGQRGSIASRNISHKFPRTSQKCAHLFPQFDCLLGEKTVLERVLVVFGGSGPRCAAMHPATFFSVYGRRFARATFSGFGSAALAGQHRNGVAWMIVGHLLDLRLARVALRGASSKVFIANSVEWASAGVDEEALSGAVSRGFWVTLPTIA
jgi:hypothetical protein